MPSSAFKTCALRSEEHTSELQYGSISYAVSLDRKSTRLNSSHGSISYAVFCLKKKNTHMRPSPFGTVPTAAALHHRYVSRRSRPHTWPRRPRPESMAPRGPEPSFFFFNDTATTEIYTLSLHDALPI